MSQSFKPTIEQLSYILNDSSISRDHHLLTGYESCDCNLRRMGVKFLSQIESFILPN